MELKMQSECKQAKCNHLNVNCATATEQEFLHSQLLP